MLLVALFAGSVYTGVVYLESTPASIVIQEGTDVPYTSSQLEAMMEYHGAIVARFDRGAWRFLKDGSWIAIENGDALRYALQVAPSLSKSM